jgi:O-antigen ligase
MANFITADNQKFTQQVLFLSRVSLYIFLAYVLLDVKAGGDIKHVVPYTSCLFSILYLVIERDFQLFRSSLFYALTGYVLVSYLLIPFSFAPAISLADANKYILNGLFLFIAVYVHTRSKRETDLMLVYLMCIIGFALFGAYYTSFSEFNAGINGRHWFYPYVKLGPVKFKMQHNGFAMMVNMLIPILIASLVSARDEKKNFLALLIGLSAVAVLLSLSRAGWAVLGLTFVLWALYLGKKARQVLASLAYPGIITILLIISVWIAVPSFGLIISETGAQLDTVNSRTVIWHRVMRAFTASPLYGWGLGDRIIWDEKPYVASGKEKKLVFDKIGYHSHNMILDVLYHQGIIGLFFFSVFMGAGFLLALRGVKSETDPLFFSVACVFIGVFFLHGIIEIVYFTWICFISGFLSGRYAAAAPLWRVHDKTG